MEKRENSSRQELAGRFAQPGAAYRGKPFWSWNGELEKEELLRQVHVLKEMGFGGFFMHSRAGLATEYLGDEWFDLINAVADEGERLGMEAWLYDEDRWPSGSAGGKVTVEPQYRMKSLVLAEMDPARFAWTDAAVCVFAARLDGLALYACRQLQPGEDPAAAAAALDGPGEPKILCFTVEPDPCSSTYNGTTYIDTMSTAAVRRFMELTHEEYKKRCGDRLGRSIKGIFTDEPHRGHTLDDRRVEDGVMKCSVSYTDDLFAEFEKRYGYDPVPKLPELFYRPEGRAVAPVKRDYIDLCCSLFVERFAEPIDRWCRENGMVFTGHVLHEDSLVNQTVPNGSLMRFYEHMGYPGIDVLGEGNRCWWVAKQLDSAARQCGKPWRLSELYGCTGWQMDFRSHKAVGDWQALFGVNVRCPHLSWYTMEGEAKRDYPASILHQSPWYADYDLVESYFARFGVLMSEGEPACDVLVLNPIESVWCQAYAGWANWIYSADPAASALERRYAELFGQLAGRQIDFDYGEEEMLSRLAAVEQTAGGRPVLRVGRAAYRVVVVSGMVTMRPSTAALLSAFLEAGGTVIFAGDPPAYLNAEPSDVPSALAAHAGAVTVPAEAAAEAVQRATAYHTAVSTGQGTPDPQVFCRVRLCEAAGCRIAVVLNTDRERPREQVTVTLDAGGASAVEEWDLRTGKRYAVPQARFRDGLVEISTSLYAAGSRAFVLLPAPEAAAPQEKRRPAGEVVLREPVAYRLSEETPCVLDFARWRFRGGEWQPAQEVLRVDAAVRDLVGIEHRGGGMLQPCYAKRFDAEVYGELELEYEFFVDELPEGPLTLAAERPERNEYRLNGTPLHCPDPGRFWVDIAFKRMPLELSLLRPGRNVVTVKTAFRRTSNVETVYLLGRFGVALDGVRKTLTALPERIGFGNLADYRLPFYTGSVFYELPAGLPSGLELTPGDRITLSPESFHGALFKVYADGRLLDRVGWEPYEADVTEALREGQRLTVELVGTRRNTFGPLHLVPLYDTSYGPEHFVMTGERWTDAYNLIDSGIHGGIRLTVQRG